VGPALSGTGPEGRAACRSLARFSFSSEFAARSASMFALFSFSSASTRSEAYLRAAQHNTARCSTVQHGTAQHGAARHSTARCSTAQHSTAQHGAARCSTVQHSTAQHSTARCSTALRSAHACAHDAALHADRIGSDRIDIVRVVGASSQQATTTCNDDRQRRHERHAPRIGWDRIAYSWRLVSSSAVFTAMMSDDCAHIACSLCSAASPCTAVLRRRQ
jgi:transglutaminase/protease-like cytokinesis protein 3